jgi:hypothetical protein
MVLKIGLKLQSLYLIGKESNADSAGIIIWIQTLTKANGQMRKSGSYFYYIPAMGTNGHKFQSICLVEQITI